MAAAERTGPRSGSLVAVIGVGTQTKTASALARSASSGPSDAQAVLERGGEPLVGDVVDRRGAGVQLRDARSDGVDAVDREARLRECDRQREADVAEPDDGNARVFRQSSLQIPG